MAGLFLRVHEEKRVPNYLKVFTKYKGHETYFCTAVMIAT